MISCMLFFHSLLAWQTEGVPYQGKDNQRWLLCPFSQIPLQVSLLCVVHPTSKPDTVEPLYKGQAVFFSEVTNLSFVQRLSSFLSVHYWRLSCIHWFFSLFAAASTSTLTLHLMDNTQWGLCLSQALSKSFSTTK